MVFSCGLSAAEVSGVGSAAREPEEIVPGLVFSVVTQAPKNTLHWRIARGGTGADAPAAATTGNEAVMPGESYAYHWDAEGKVFWFSTIRSLVRIDISDRAVARRLSRPASGYASYKDLPPAFRDHVKQILE